MRDETRFYWALKPAGSGRTGRRCATNRTAVGDALRPPKRKEGAEDVVCADIHLVLRVDTGAPGAHGGAPAGVAQDFLNVTRGLREESRAFRERCGQMAARGRECAWTCSGRGERRVRGCCGLTKSL